jgi:16S rRNA (guanine527-N7)-methyltransferase
MTPPARHSASCAAPAARQGPASTCPRWRGLALLAARHSLPAAAVGQLTTLAALLADDPVAPTSVREPHLIVDNHLADSLVALELPELASALELADLGAGAGLPGLPLAIARPDLAVTLVESNARKCSFIERAVAACGLSNALVVAARAEAWRQGIGSFDVITARALAPLEVVVEYAAPLLRPEGVLIAWRGRRETEHEGRGARAAAIVGLEPADPIRVSPYAGAEHRHLHLFQKVGPTPTRFPRRPGIARKRPLGGDPSAVEIRPDGNASDRERR